MAASKSKYAQTIASIRQQAAERPDAPAPARAEPMRGKGRPPGKRSDPDYQPTTVLLRKHTKKTAARMLEDTDSVQDLSDLIEQLLTEWIRKQM